MFELFIVFGAAAVVIVLAAWLSISPDGGYTMKRSLQNQKPILEADHMDMNDMLSVNYQPPHIDRDFDGRP